MGRLFTGAVIAGCSLLVGALPAQAEDTLTKIRAEGAIYLGVRIDSMPFSYKLPSGKPVGYAVDLCEELVNDISAALDGMRLKVTYRPVTAEDRIARVVNGDIDLECGSTTNNAQRRQLVAFSPVFFVAGTKILVPRRSPVQSYRDLVGRTVVVTSATTNEAAMRELVDRLLIRTTIITAPDNQQSFRTLKAGHADAFASDDVLLSGLAATPDGAAFHVVGGFLSYEPYGLMYRKDDPAFAAVVEGGFRRMAASGRLADLYTKWLVNRLPTGERTGIPMSTELAQIFRVLGAPD